MSSSLQIQTELKNVVDLLYSVKDLKKIMDELFHGNGSKSESESNTKNIELVKPNPIPVPVVVNSYFDCYQEKEEEKESCICNWNSDERLEKRCDAHSESKIMLNRINKQQQQIDELTNMLSSQHREMESLKQILSKKDRDISMIRSTLSELQQAQTKNTYTTTKITEMANNENIKLNIIEQDEVERSEEEEPEEQQDDESEEEEPEEEEPEEDEPEEEEQPEEVDHQPEEHQPEEEQQEEEELYEIEIDNINYCTNDEVNGFIYEMTKEGDVGKKVGYFKDSDCVFY
jgi:hypothetical protein